ncbi:uncharacterized protein MONBRDRAFT_11978 [Monosiga brevicollis MX1]|uniref:Uncharacterized protein n=1 Tax=Monosiga brevicollis TaxID=81824 RepID=A9VAV3_MONBE|nr:uncharacterized protein MONBRDRAFT_11978 [Monosiga brevicollis MX1]EDQ85385.1 predicted protein [Monosiga brevicollis MX1]|eukprot:XP_001749796.1 hypothetical protein [Monosiga brevicollis MX1]
MASIARHTLAAQSTANQVFLIEGASTEVSASKLFPNDADVASGQQPPHVLVSEIVDSELLGEGILPSLRDANEPSPWTLAAARYLQASHDDYRIWFDLIADKPIDAAPSIPRSAPTCTCGAHQYGESLERFHDPAYLSLACAVSANFSDPAVAEPAADFLQLQTWPQSAPGTGYLTILVVPIQCAAWHEAITPVKQALGFNMDVYDQVAQAQLPMFMDVRMDDYIFTELATAICLQSSDQTSTRLEWELTKPSRVDALMLYMRYELPAAAADDSLVPSAATTTVLDLHPARARWAQQQPLHVGEDGTLSIEMSLDDAIASEIRPPTWSWVAA